MFEDSDIDYIRASQLKGILKDDCFDAMVSADMLNKDFNQTTFRGTFTFERNYNASKHLAAYTFYHSEPELKKRKEDLRKQNRKMGLCQLGYNQGKLKG